MSYDIRSYGKAYSDWVNPRKVRVIVPMKPLPYTKMRLRDELPFWACDALVLYMLKSVLKAVEAARLNLPCLVLGGDEPVRRIAQEVGVDWAPEKAQGLNEALTIAMREAFDDGMEAALYLPGDVPFIEGITIARIVFGKGRLHRPVGVPSETGGTNALLVPAAAPITLSLGEKSYARHREAAKQAGTRILTKKFATAMFDIDTPQDLTDVLEEWPPFEDLLMDWAAWLYDGMEGPSPNGQVPLDALFYGDKGEDD